MRVIKNKILVKKLENPYKEVNGIIMPQENEGYGEVMAVGDDVKGVAVSDRILFFQRAILLRENIMVISDEEVLAVLDKEDL